MGKFTQVVILLQRLRYVSIQISLILLRLVKKHDITSMPDMNIPEKSIEPKNVPF